MKESPKTFMDTLRNQAEIKFRSEVLRNIAIDPMSATRPLKYKKDSKVLLGFETVTIEQADAGMYLVKFNDGTLDTYKEDDLTSFN